jgi:hypothetical protein
MLSERQGICGKAVTSHRNPKLSRKETENESGELPVLPTRSRQWAESRKLKR